MRKKTLTGLLVALICLGASAKKAIPLSVEASAYIEAVETVKDVYTGMPPSYIANELGIPSREYRVADMQVIEWESFGPSCMLRTGIEKIPGERTGVPKENTLPSHVVAAVSFEGDRKTCLYFKAAAEQFAEKYQDDATFKRRKANAKTAAEIFWKNPSKTKSLMFLAPSSTP